MGDALWQNRPVPAERPLSHFNKIIDWMKYMRDLSCQTDTIRVLDEIHTYCIFVSTLYDYEVMRPKQSVQSSFKKGPDGLLYVQYVAQASVSASQMPTKFSPAVNGPVPRGTRHGTQRATREIDTEMAANV